MAKPETRIGGTLKTLLKEKSVTQYRMAKDTGLQHATVSRLINDKSGPDISTLITLANYFQVSTDRILGRESSIDRILGRK